MKKTLFAVSLVCGLFIIGSAFAGLPVSVKSDLTRVVIFVKHSDGDLFNLVMKDGRDCQEKCV